MLPARGVKKKMGFAFAAKVKFHAIEYNSGRFKSSTIVADMSISNYNTALSFNTLVQEGILERISAQVGNHKSTSQYPDLLSEQYWAVINP